MGTDCSLFTEKGKHILDRWYCFNYVIEHKKIYNKQDFIKKLYECIDYHIDDFVDSNKKEQIQNKKHLSYCICWCYDAFINVGEKNVIINDSDDLYHEYNILNEELIKKLLKKS